MKLVRQALPAYFNGRFSRRPDRAVTVVLLATQRAFDAFYKKQFGPLPSSDLGFYDRGLREVLVNAGPGVHTLTHELVHPIVQSDFPDAPAWLNEGLGALFEAPVFPRPDEIHGTKNWRLPRLRAALSTGAGARPRGSMRFSVCATGISSTPLTKAVFTGSSNECLGQRARDRARS